VVVIVLDSWILVLYVCICLSTFSIYSRFNFSHHYFSVSLTNCPLSFVMSQESTPSSFLSATTMKDTLALDCVFLHFTDTTLPCTLALTGSQSLSLLANTDGLVHSAVNVPSVIRKWVSILMVACPSVNVIVSLYMRSSRGASTLVCLRWCVAVSAGRGWSMVKFLAFPVMMPDVITCSVDLFPSWMVLDVPTRAPAPMAVEL